jgi:2-oxoisovalerate dehydrogenase E1 component alpha subunit
VNESQKLSLHVPEPSSRPGDQPDFSYLKVPPAGSARRPELDCPSEDMHDLAFDLVRVLDDNHVAVGPWAMELDETLLLQGLRAMEKTRIFDDRMLMAQRQGKTSIYVQCRGEEAIACGQMISGGNRWRL